MEIQKNSNSRFHTNVLFWGEFSHYGYKLFFKFFICCVNLKIIVKFFYKLVNIFEFLKKN